MTSDADLEPGTDKYKCDNPFYMLLLGSEYQKLQKWQFPLTPQLPAGFTSPIVSPYACPRGNRSVLTRITKSKWIV
jgi:hypothetical protein